MKKLMMIALVLLMTMVAAGPVEERLKGLDKPNARQKKRGKSLKPLPTINKRDTIKHREVIGVSEEKVEKVKADKLAKKEEVKRSAEN